MTDMEVRNDAEGLGAPFDLPGLAAGRLTVLVQRNPDGEFLDFIRVGQDLRFAHAYLAELTTGGPAPLRQLALRVQRDMYDDEDQAPSVTNPQIEELWEDEHRYLLRFARQANDPRVLQYFALPPGDDGRLAVFPPILYLSTAEVFFHPACPSCGGGLRVCRDLKLLASRSLAPFSTSSRRYLYCRSCAEKTPNAVVFYRKLASESEQAAGVRSEYELYEDLKGAAGGKNTVEVMPVGGAAPRAIPAAQFDPACIRAFSFYDCRIIPVGCQSITYRQFCDCLGGIEWQPFLDRHERDLGPPQVMPSVAALRSVLEDPGRFLFAGHPGGMHTVEIFRLKLAMMRQLAAALDQYHTGVGLPHLGLDPDHILIDVPRSAGSQGALWSFKVRLGTLAATHRMTCGEGGDALTVLARPAGTGEAFLPPFAVNMRLYQVNRCDLTPESVDEVTPGVFRLNLTLECRAADLTQFSRRDLLELSMAGAPFRQRVALHARIAGEPQAHSVALETIPVRMDADQVEVFRCHAGRVLRGASFRCYPVFHVPCDLYGMGLLFLMALLEGPGQDLAVLKRDLVAVVAAELKRTRDRTQNATPEELTELVRTLIHDSDITQPWRVAFAQNPAAANAVPEELWERALLLALRMCTMTPGFSFCADRSDWPADEPWRLMRSVGAALDDLCREVHAYLLGGHPTAGTPDALVHAVRRLQEEFPAATAGEPRDAQELIARLHAVLQAAEPACRERGGEERVAVLLQAMRKALDGEPADRTAAALAALAPQTETPGRAGPTLGDLHEQVAAYKAENAALHTSIEELRRALASERERLTAALRKACEGPRPQDAASARVEQILQRPDAAVQALSLLVTASHFAADVSRNARGLMSKEFLGIEAHIPTFHQVLCSLKDYESIKEYLLALRTCIKAVAIVPCKVAEDWASDLRKTLAPERFLPQERLAPLKAKERAWDAYNDFYRHFNFEADLLPRIRAAVETQVAGALRSLGRFDANT